MGANESGLSNKISDRNLWSLLALVLQGIGVVILMVGGWFTKSALERLDKHEERITRVEDRVSAGENAQKLFSDNMTKNFDELKKDLKDVQSTMNVVARQVGAKP